MATGSLPRKRLRFAALPSRLSKRERATRPTLNFDAPPPRDDKPRPSPPQDATLEPATVDAEWLNDAKARFDLSPRELQVLRAIACMEDADATPDCIAWAGSESDIAAAAGVARNTASRGIAGVERKGLVTSRKRVAGGGIKEYRIRLNVIRDEVSIFGRSTQRRFPPERAHAARLGAPSIEGGRAQAAGLGAPRADSLSPPENPGGRAHPHDLIEMNESKIQSLQSNQPGRAQPWTWTLQQLADPACVDSEIIPAAIARFGLIDSEQVRLGIAAAACCACAKGGVGLFTRFIDTRAWQRSRAARHGETYIAEEWIAQAQAIRRPATSAGGSNAAAKCLAQDLAQPLIESKLDALPDDALAQLARRALRSAPPAQHAWQALQSMRERRANYLIRPLLLRQLESERTTAGAAP